MVVTLNHTLVPCRDGKASAQFVGEILDCPLKVQGPFHQVQIANGLTLDFLTVVAEQEITPHHYGLLVSDDDFDEIFGRISERELPIWADMFQAVAGEINHFDNGRGVYFEDPSGHYFEVFTRPYGSGGTTGKDVAAFVASRGTKLGRRVKTTVAEFEM